MKKILTLTVFAAMMALTANGAWASGSGPFPANLTNGYYGGTGGTPTPNSNTGEYEIYNAVNLLLGTPYTSNAQLDPIEYTGNTSVWTQTSNGGYAFISLGAGATNTLDVYNTNTPNTMSNVLGLGFSGNGNVGTGQPGSPFYGTKSIIPVGGTFGFNLNSSAGYNWNSNPTVNIDGMDHMLVYNLSALDNTTISIYDPNTNTDQLATLQDPYLVAVEDEPIGNNTNGSPSDLDYNDYVFLVDGATPGIVTDPVPEPMTLALFAFGLMVIAGFGMRRKFAFIK